VAAGRPCLEFVDADVHGVSCPPVAGSNHRLTFVVNQHRARGHDMVGSQVLDQVNAGLEFSGRHAPVERLGAYFGDRDRPFRSIVTAAQRAVLRVEILMHAVTMELFFQGVCVKPP